MGDKETNSEGIYVLDVLGYNFAKLLRTVRLILFSPFRALDHGQHMAVGFERIRHGSGGRPKL